MPPQRQQTHRNRRLPPPLRTTEAEKAAEYQRFVLGREELDREEARINDALVQLASRQAQLTQDIAREKNLLGDAKAAVARLTNESKLLATQIEGAEPQQVVARDALDKARTTATLNDANLAETSAALRAAAATRDNLASRKKDLDDRITSATDALAQLSLEALLADAEQSDQEKLEAETNFLAANKVLETAEQALLMPT